MRHELKSGSASNFLDQYFDEFGDPRHIRSPLTSIVMSRNIDSGDYEMKEAIIVGAAIAGLSACSSTEMLGNRAVEYNHALEYSTNVTTLSNIVRAAKRLPMIYSRMGSMSYTGSIDAKPSLNVGIGAGSTEDAFTFGIDNKDSGVTPFDALTGQKFYNAINTSISPSLIATYRDRGWSDDILFPLFIEKIEIERVLIPGNTLLETVVSAGEKTHTKLVRKKTTQLTNVGESDSDILTFVNDPMDPMKFIAFKSLSRAVIEAYDINLEVVQEEFPTKYYSVLKGRNIAISSMEAKFLNGYREAFLRSAFKEIDLSTFPAKYKILGDVIFEKKTPKKRLSFRLKQPQQSGASSEQTEVPQEACAIGIKFDEKEASCTTESSKLKIYLRSPNDMVYYLGEVLRAQNEKSAQYKRVCSELSGNKDGNYTSATDFAFGVYKLCPTRDEFEDGSAQRMFHVESSLNIPGGLSELQRSRSLFTFELHDQRYWISADPNRRGRTMQYVALINELFFLQQEASSPTPVNIIQGATIQNLQ